METASRERDHSPAINQVRALRGQSHAGGPLYPEDQARLRDATDVERRLSGALHEAGRFALGMPGTVDTFKAMLAQAGLALALA